MSFDRMRTGHIRQSIVDCNWIRREKAAESIQPKPNRCPNPDHESTTMTGRRPPRGAPPVPLQRSSPAVSAALVLVRGSPRKLRPERDAICQPSAARLHEPALRPRLLNGEAAGELDNGKPRATRQRRAPVLREDGGVAGGPWASGPCAGGTASSSTTGVDDEGAAARRRRRPRHRLRPRRPRGRRWRRRGHVLVVDVQAGHSAGAPQGCEPSDAAGCATASASTDAGGRCGGSRGAGHRRHSA